MKTFAGMIVHYGADYIGYAAAAIAPHVDRIVVIYTPEPSHGHTTRQLCPETGMAIHNALVAVDPSIAPKIEWRENIFASEGVHRAYMENLCWNLGADEIVVVDADEVWPEEYLHTCLDHARRQDAKQVLVHMDHFWRSFHWACHEPAMPVRILRKNGNGTTYAPRGDPSILHFGYAQRSDIVRYKMSIHGHKNEIRSGWFESIFQKWPEIRKDVHPTCTTDEGWWNPFPFDKSKMPEIMKKHPFYDLEVIP